MMKIFKKVLDKEKERYFIFNICVLKIKNKIKNNHNLKEFYFCGIKVLKIDKFPLFIEDKKIIYLFGAKIYTIEKQYKKVDYRAVENKGNKIF